MLERLKNAAFDPLVDRAVLVGNHMLRRDAEAQQRLRAHAGKRLQLAVVGVPAWSPLGAPPDVWVEVTPAGLFERLGTAENPPADAAVPALKIGLDAADPLAWVRAWRDGQQPAWHLSGDSSLAADLQWLAAHVRWSPAEELHTAFGPGIGAAAAMVEQGLAKGVATLKSLAERSPFGKSGDSSRWPRP